MNRYNIIAILFILIILIISTCSIAVNKEYIIEDKSEASFNERISHIFGENNAFAKLFINIWSTLNSYNNQEVSLLDDVEYGHLIKDDRGYLYFPTNRVDVNDYAKKTITLAHEIPNFTYIQAPNKMIKGFTNLHVYEYNCSNENADNFLSILKKNGVKYYDLRTDIEANGNYDSMFYKTDHHWNNNTAFLAYTKIVEHLNNSFGLNIDKDNYYRDINNYKITDMDNCFLGSLGRRTGQAVSGLDSYTYIEPKFDTYYTLYNMLDLSGDVGTSGSFENTIKIKHILEDTNVESNKYSSYFEWDYGYLRVLNNKINNNIKILLIKDSYALPVGAYLSTCVQELDMIDVRDTPKPDLNKILSENNYDAVVMLYNTESFTDLMFSF